VFGARFHIAIDEYIRETRHKDPAIEREGIDPYPELGLGKELTPKEVMVEIIISRQIKDPGIIGEAHSTCEDLRKIIAPHDLDLGICRVEQKSEMIEEGVPIGKTPQDLILDLIPPCKREISQMSSIYNGGKA
jgi:hypothetical protein